MKYDMNKPCPHCGGNPKIANPTGKCSHIHYPEAVNKELLPLAAEEKAGDEGLREALEAVCQTHLYKMDNSFRQGAQAMYDSFAKRHPAPDPTVDDGLRQRLEAWLKEKQESEMTASAIEVAHILYATDATPDRTAELVKRVREWVDCRELYTLDYDGNPTVIDKGFATAQEEVGKILADFEKGTS